MLLTGGTVQGLFWEHIVEQSYHVFGNEPKQDLQNLLTCRMSYPTRTTSLASILSLLFGFYERAKELQLRILAATSWATLRSWISIPCIDMCLVVSQCFLDVVCWGISTLEEELASARREGESLQGAEAALKSTLAQKEFALLDALASSEARRANEAALRSALQNQEKLLADERVAKDVAERHLAERAAQMVDLQKEMAEMQAPTQPDFGVGATKMNTYQVDSGG